MLSTSTCRGYLAEKYNWGYNYYMLTDEGVEYIRDYLHLDASAFPETHIQKSSKGQEEGEEEAERPARGGKWGRD